MGFMPAEEFPCPTWCVHGDGNHDRDTLVQPKHRSAGAYARISSRYGYLVDGGESYAHLRLELSQTDSERRPWVTFCHVQGDEDYKMVVGRETRLTLEEAENLARALQMMVWQATVEG
jgi:diadenosine tetraphosphatase ApaH/serine/threonine PP2A family protein phosphatase